MRLTDREDYHYDFKLPERGGRYIVAGSPVGQAVHYFGVGGMVTVLMLTRFQFYTHISTQEEAELVARVATEAYETAMGWIGPVLGLDAPHVGLAMSRDKSLLTAPR